VRLCQRLLADHITRSAKQIRADTGASDNNNDPILLNLQPTSSISVYIEATNSRRNQVGSYCDSPAGTPDASGVLAGGEGEENMVQTQESGQSQSGQGMYVHALYISVRHMRATHANSSFLLFHTGVLSRPAFGIGPGPMQESFVELTQCLQLLLKGMCVLMSGEYQTAPLTFCSLAMSAFVQELYSCSPRALFRPQRSTLRLIRAVSTSHRGYHQKHCHR
jgi:hypothetical protein